jgi:membrane-anchored protein YejM (alkaline phosphatase superfamily)
MDPNLSSQVGFRVAVPRLRLALHLPLLALIGLNILLGRIWLLTHLPKVPAAELAPLVLAGIAHGSVLFLAIALVLGILTSLTTGRLASLIWGVATAGTTVFWLDAFGYRWLDLHVDETLTLLAWNVRGDFLVMRSKLLLFGLGLLLLFGLFIGATAFHRATSQRSWGRHQVSAPMLGLSLLVSILAAIVPIKALLEKRVSDTARYAFHQAEWPVDLITSPRRAILTIEHPRFQPPPDPSTLETQLRKLRGTQLARRPNIFLFVVESLRADAVSADGAPNLFQLRRDSLPILDGQANGNCTHIAWLSLFNSSSPLYWSLLAKSPERSGAVPLRVLRALGYRVSVLSTPNLHYFDMDRILFSGDLSLADVLVDQSALTSADLRAEPADLDRLVMDRLLDSVDSLTPDSGHFFTVFLDAPHHDYTWGRGFSPRYQPYLESVNLFKTHYAEDEIALLKNRYRNSVYFVDSLLGEFVERLKQRGLWEDSFIVVVGDHGEEFMERGHLTHSSELNRFQTSIALLIHIPPAFRSPSQTPIQIASQVDVFPTLFDLLGVRHETECLLWGDSLVGPQPPRFAISARCSSFVPKQMVIMDGTRKVLLEFDGIASTNFAHGLHARRLRFVDLLDQQDRSLAAERGADARVTEDLRLGFAAALPKLLTNPDERANLPILGPDRRSAAQLGTRSPYCRQ